MRHHARHAPPIPGLLTFDFPRVCRFVFAFLSARLLFFALEDAPFFSEIRIFLYPDAASMLVQTE